MTIIIAGQGHDGQWGAYQSNGRHAGHFLHMLMMMVMGVVVMVMMIVVMVTGMEVTQQCWLEQSKNDDSGEKMMTQGMMGMNNMQHNGMGDGMNGMNNGMQVINTYDHIWSPADGWKVHNNETNMSNVIITCINQMNGMVNPNMMNPGMRGMMSMNNGMQVSSVS